MKWMALVCIALALAVVGSVGETTTHFNVKYSDPAAATPGAGQTLEDAYKAVNNYFGNLPKSIKVVVVDGDEMDNVGKQVEAFSAWNHRSSTIVLRDKTLKDKKSLDVVARHEICHLALNDLLERKGEKDFAWTEEGICMVVSREPMDDVKVAKYIVAHGFKSPAEIAKAIDSDDYPTCKNGYLQSYSLCKFIASRFGLGALVRMVKSPTASFDAAFRQQTGASFDTVYKAWKASVTENARGIPVSQTVSLRGALSLN